MKTTIKKITIQDMDRCLKLGTIPVTLKRRAGRYIALMPATITRDGGVAEVSHVELYSSGSSKQQFKLDACRRYSAEVFAHSDVFYISPRNAMKSPNWGGRFGALPEITHAAKRAGLI